ncbi:hypothetical protein B9479_007260 [Cryptococcus floricola]|uniref:Uncharacterized protein n=1 Tax=Cryptococcus floricola TaxID=2591691 RepID=A0A5D3AKV3_9TREE|nr:hypothetical protein B9479_007260 [Cryptococcus floricola]
MPSKKSRIIAGRRAAQPHKPNTRKTQLHNDITSLISEITSSVYAADDPVLQTATNTNSDVDRECVKGGSWVGWADDVDALRRPHEEWTRLLEDGRQTRQSLDPLQATLAKTKEAIHTEANTMFNTKTMPQHLTDLPSVKQYTDELIEVRDLQVTLDRNADACNEFYKDVLGALEKDLRETFDGMKDLEVPAEAAWASVVRGSLLLQRESHQFYNNLALRSKLPTTLNPKDDEESILALAGHWHKMREFAQGVSVWKGKVLESIDAGLSDMDPHTSWQAFVSNGNRLNSLQPQIVKELPEGSMDAETGLPLGPETSWQVEMFSIADASGEEGARHIRPHVTFTTHPSSFAPPQCPTFSHAKWFNNGPIPNGATSCKEDTGNPGSLYIYTTGQEKSLAMQYSDVLADLAGDWGESLLKTRAELNTGLGKLAKDGRAFEPAQLDVLRDLADEEGILEEAKGAIYNSIKDLWSDVEEAHRKDRHEGEEGIRSSLQDMSEASQDLAQRWLQTAELVNTLDIMQSRRAILNRQMFMAESEGASLEISSQLETVDEEITKRRPAVKESKKSLRQAFAEYGLLPIPNDVESLISDLISQDGEDSIEIADQMGEERDDQPPVEEEDIHAILEASRLDRSSSQYMGRSVFDTPTWSDFRIIDENTFQSTRADGYIDHTTFVIAPPAELELEQEIESGEEYLSDDSSADT